MSEQAELVAGSIVDLISEAIRAEEDEAFDATVETRTAEGWANPTVQAQNEWQGHDNGVVFGTFAEALEYLIEYNGVPAGCNNFDPEEWEDADDAESKKAHLLNAFSSAGKIGTGEPLAYIGVDTYFTLICAGATREQIKQAAIDCLSSDGE